MSPVEVQRWAFSGLGAGTIFLEVGFIVCPLPKIDLWRWAP
jgi:hypothetical protein